jgi:UDP-3-O-[3-hydroxymyristoyl] glucosamine N-acyltransferase
MVVTLGELAVRFGCELRGDPDTPVDSVATLSNAHPRAVTFLANPKYRTQVASTKAAAVIIDPKNADACKVAALVCANPYATYARIAATLHPLPRPPAGIHATAVVADDARIDPTASIGPLCVVGPGVTVGARAVIGPQCTIESGVSIAEDVYLFARVTLCRNVQIGPRAVCHSGVVIGSDGFGFAPEPGGAWLKVPQVGSVRIGPDVDIGANTTVDRGAIDDTVIEEGVKLDNQIQIGHNVRIGAHTAIAACVGISGSTTIGKRCMIGGASGFAGHLTITDDVVVTGFTMVTRSITKPGTYSGGLPMEEARVWRRMVGRFKRLDVLAERLAAVERATGVNVNSQPDNAKQDESDV